jgi:hypothetical protein
MYREWQVGDCVLPPRGVCPDGAIIGGIVNDVNLAQELAEVILYGGKRPHSVKVLFSRLTEAEDVRLREEIRRLSDAFEFCSIE